MLMYLDFPPKLISVAFLQPPSTTTAYFEFHSSAPTFMKHFISKSNPKVKLRLQDILSPFHQFLQPAGSFFIRAG